MRLTRTTWLLFAALALLTRKGTARVIPNWMPEQLIEKSTFVCNGMPTEVVTNGETGDKEGERALGYSATIRILKVLKGDPTIATITLRYFRLAPPLRIINPPPGICLEEGKRYRFYLRESKEQHTYVPCLMGSSDDGFSVEAFTGEQADDSKPFTKTEAVKMAEEYLKKNRPDIAIEPSATDAFYWSDGCWDGKTKPPIWSVIFYGQVPGVAPPNHLAATSRGAVARIWVLSDGSLVFHNPNDGQFP
jgi:hypothetical protein